MAKSYALFAARYAPCVGGVESYTANLAHELVAQGNQVYVVTSEVPGADAFVGLQEDGVFVLRLPSLPLMGARLPVSIPDARHLRRLRLLMRLPIDRVLVNNRFYPHSLVGLELAARRDLPVVVLDHGSSYLTLGSPVADAALHAWEHAFTAACKRAHPRFAGVSAASVAWLRTFRIITPHVIPNAIDAAAFRGMSSGRDFRSELGVADDQILVSFAGRLAADKGALALGLAARQLGDRFVFALAGAGPQERALVELGSVRLLGVLSHQDLSALYAVSDAFCLPTRSEGFSTSLLEAASWGVFPLMPRVGGVDEVMGDPLRFGALLDDTRPETIAREIEERARAGMLGHSEALAREVKEHHSWRASVESLEAAFSD